MIKPCSQPLKVNPFTSYRDPVTGKWTVVNTAVNNVENACESDSSLKQPVPSPKASQTELKQQVQPEVLRQPKRLSFSLLPFKKSAGKSAVNVRS